MDYGQSIDYRPFKDKLIDKGRLRPI